MTSDTTIRAKAKAPVLQNTIGQAVATPTDKRGFAMPKFWGLVRLHLSHMVSGVGVPIRKDGSMAGSM